MDRLILGTAGHIDHGKTTLVRALTGVDTDRLPEEKRRGITIDLGFAALDLPDGTRFGIVDVPGHEAFVRNMLAGASGVDVALLVVAADEGVMPQTREHLAILQLLGIRALVTALTKADLVDDEWRELAIDDVRALLARSPWPDAPVVAVSGATGAGVDALRLVLADAARGAHGRLRDDLFRMPVDRVFTVHGTGTVATGTVWSGSVRRDDQLQAVPAGATVRVRAVQSHGVRADGAGAGERAALALANVDTDELGRGDTLVSGVGWSAASVLTVRLSLLPEARTLRPGQRVRVHLGTAEVMARVTLLGAPEVAPGTDAWAQLRLERPLVARARDRIVIRTYSPVTTIAGAVIAEPDAPRRGRLDGELREQLGAILNGEPVGALGACAGIDPWQGVARAALPVATGLAPGVVASLLDAHNAGVCVTATRVFTARILDAALNAIDAAMDGWHADNPLEAGCEREVLRRALPEHAHAEIVLAAIDRLAEAGRLTVSGALHSRRAWQPTISPEHATLLATARQACADAGLAAPDASELPAPLGDHPDRAAVLRLLERQGELVAIEPGRYLSATVLSSAIEAARAAFATRADLGPGDFRDIWGITRKHLIPLLEYLDRTGVTVRKGDRRRLA